MILIYWEPSGQIDSEHQQEVGVIFVLAYSRLVCLGGVAVGYKTTLCGWKFFFIFEVCGTDSHQHD
eukprot:scaffold1448_cov109-Cylindrotheca_fusiformis.AAC.1